MKNKPNLAFKYNSNNRSIINDTWMVDLRNAYKQKWWKMLFKSKTKCTLENLQKDLWEKSKEIAVLKEQVIVLEQSGDLYALLMRDVDYKKIWINKNRLGVDDQDAKEARVQYLKDGYTLQGTIETDYMQCEIYTKRS